jgi:hypothetical protein
MKPWINLISECMGNLGDYAAKSTDLQLSLTCNRDNSAVHNSSSIFKSDVTPHNIKQNPIYNFLLKQNLKKAEIESIGDLCKSNFRKSIFHQGCKVDI